SETREARVGWTAGLTSTFSILENSGITVDLLYSQEGSYDKAEDREYRTNYMRMPVFFDLFFGELGDDLRPKIYAGVVPGLYLHHAVNEVTGLTNGYNKFELGLGGGMGFNYQIEERTWLNADLRYVHGLTDIFSDSREAYNRNVQLSLGVAFGL
ncbi:MAG: PorT family protein, partial [Phaeodactylibacter sp.]|nr:PorT family protein [Phaeodactylibacter sp.]